MPGLIQSGGVRSKLRLAMGRHLCCLGNIAPGGITGTQNSRIKKLNREYHSHQQWLPVVMITYMLP
jgi:hypothetical protein